MIMMKMYTDEVKQYAQHGHFSWFMATQDPNVAEHDALYVLKYSSTIKVIIKIE